MDVLQNFFVRDLAGCVAAVLVFPVFMVFPGYVIAWLCNLLRFRNESLTGRLTISVP